ncbi:Na+/H+ antiporter NhaA [Bombella sp. TMW 2.2559]|uniref:Na(+)/H(+) antiporter NhaA n=1 Tax=Bombella dulcis TaxID=2967339 RepID=A0ABT3WB87_9PROT|nr:Na+/H+ antiporter NhaA [Bombella dulcis]MCX5616201.1 Na+/H+ antiporter NhaA [Bombella dulcis]
MMERRRHWMLAPEMGGPFLLLVMAVLGLILANSPLRSVYALLDRPLEGSGPWHLSLPSIAELMTIGPMTLFFLVITLELKKELVTGHLSSIRQCLLPCLSALGGVAVPAGLYALIAAPDPALHPGWAIPVATDAAFTLPILLALGRHVSEGGRVWLMALAIFDDVLGILIIALFYGGTLHALPLMGGVVLTGLLACAGWRKVNCLWLYGVGGCLLWLCLLEGGLHPTLAGVVAGLCLPTDQQKGPSPLERVEHGVSPWVTWLVLPAFGFVTVGIPLLDVSVSALSLRLICAVAVGLVLGKTVGIFSMTWLAIKLRLASLPAHTSWQMLFGLCLLCGLGFTVSLFMASLAFPTFILLVSSKIGILVGSFIAALSGWLWLRFMGRGV